MGQRVNRHIAATAKKVPAYPGKNTAEQVVRALAGGAIDRYAGHVGQRLMGFWVLANAYGSFEAYRDSGLVSRGGAYGQRKEFLAFAGVDVMDWQPELGFELTPLGEVLGLPKLPARVRVTAGGNYE